MKGIFRLFIILTILPLFACQKDIPKPESRNIIFPSVTLASASGFVKTQKDSFIVNHFIRGNDVFIECRISNFSFRNSEKNGNQTGKMLVFIDGKKKQEYSAAAFILKDLSKGNHRISLQIVDGNGQKTSLKKEFMVTIP
ncbi:hypothetical protein ACFSO7_05295 [Bacillus sp. CGMCC 1.16607]|uniref:hypothetical protein n=1 Tax=Bacillus sp. CGMCC 1.16607 TaxID=3351842 RepID=UPI003635945D